MSRKKILIILAILVSLIYVLGLYIMIKQSKVCDEKIILMDDTVITGTSVRYREGVATINTCDGQILEIPVLNIKIVKVVNPNNNDM